MAGEMETVSGAEEFFENVPCALLVLSKTGLILKVNKTFCRWTGYNSAELIGHRKLQELLTVGGRIFYQTHWIPLLDLQRSIAEVKLDVKTAEGKTLPMVLNASRRNHRGEDFDDVCAFVVLERHRFEKELLLAKRQAEDALADYERIQKKLSVADTRLRIAYESAQLYVWDVDPKTLERRYDDQVATLLGFSTPIGIPDAAYVSFIEKDDQALEAEAFARALNSADYEYRSIYRLNGIDGKQRTVLSTGRGAFDSDGKLFQFVGVLHDISEVIYQRQMAEERALFAEQMIGIVSHDLRNPLQITLMATQYLQNTDLSPKQSTLISHIRTASSQAQRLINELLDFTQARIGQGLIVRKSVIKFDEIIGGLVKALGLVYPGKDIVFKPGAGLECYADADRITQLLGNLIANAMTYGDHCSPVTVATYWSETNVALSVHNWGKPIASELLNSIFAPMTRGHEAPQGTRSVGLGLFIVSEIAKAHDGTVEVTSCGGTGTVFTVTLPLN